MTSIANTSQWIPNFSCLSFLHTQGPQTRRNRDKQSQTCKVRFSSHKRREGRQRRDSGGSCSVDFSKGWEFILHPQLTSICRGRAFRVRSARGRCCFCFTLLLLLVSSIKGSGRGSRERMRKVRGCRKAEQSRAADVAAPKKLLCSTLLSSALPPRKRVNCYLSIYLYPLLFLSSSKKSKKV